MLGDHCCKYTDNKLMTQSEEIYLHQTVLLFRKSSKAWQNSSLVYHGIPLDLRSTPEQFLGFYSPVTTGSQ